MPLLSDDKETDAKLCKSLSMLTPAEYDALMIQVSFGNQLRWFQKQHNIKIKSISFVDGKVNVNYPRINAGVLLPKKIMNDICKSVLIINGRMFRCTEWDTHECHTWQGIICNNQVKITWLDSTEFDVSKKVIEIFKEVINIIEQPTAKEGFIEKES